MYEDHIVEERYLHNFSKKEKVKFYREHKKRIESDLKFRTELYKLIPILLLFSLMMTNRPALWKSNIF